MNLLHSPNTLESYYEIISRYPQIFDYVKGDDTTEVYTASNLLPFTLYSSYEYMSKPLPMDLSERANENTELTGRDAGRRQNRESA